MATVTLMGNVLNLVGDPPGPGTVAPDFTVLDQDLNPVSLDQFKGEILLISSVPSLDTPVCDLETRRFNQEAGNLGKGVKVLTISMDLPFAQKRWCGANGIDNVIVLSDYRDADFGNKYKVLIKELRLLARCVFLIDAKGTIRYVQLVREISQEPNYGEIIEHVKKLLSEKE